MTAQGKTLPRGDVCWSWPIDRTSYDCSSQLTEEEQQEIALVAARSGGQPKHTSQVLYRLLTPLGDICQKIQENYSDWTNQNRRASTIRAFVLEMNRRQTSFWAWSELEWIEFIAPSLEVFNARLGWSWRRDSKPEAGTRTRVLLAAYLLGALPDVRVCGTYLPYTKLARLAFGEQWLSPTIDWIITYLRSVGYSSQKAFEITRPACIVLLLARSPFLEDITEEHIRWVHATTPREQYEIATLSRVLVSFGILKVGIPKSAPGLSPQRPECRWLAGFGMGRVVQHLAKNLDIRADNSQRLLHQSPQNWSLAQTGASRDHLTCSVDGNHRHQVCGGHYADDRWTIYWRTVSFEPSKRPQPWPTHQTSDDQCLSRCSALFLSRFAGEREDSPRLQSAALPGSSSFRPQQNWP